MQSSKLTYDTMLAEMQNYNYVTILIPYESICWRGINVGGLAVER